MLLGLLTGFSVTIIGVLGCLLCLREADIVIIAPQRCFLKNDNSKLSNKLVRIIKTVMNSLSN